MANLLRRIKRKNHANYHDLDNNTTSPQRSTCDQSRFEEFREKVARKASTFSLRTKPGRGGGKSSDQQSGAHTFIAFEDEFNDPHTNLNFGEEIYVGARVSHDISAPYPPPVPNHRFTTPHESQYRATPSSQPRLVDILTRELPAVYDRTRPQQSEGIRDATQELQTEDLRLTTCAKMASEQARPPVPYERLKQLTTEACDSTLSSTKTYAHANTESWNTTIINTLLTALVTESAPDAGDAQPNYKFIVNSTIIQHAPVASGASDDAVRSAGRRGMHSASGAFWNNERDGMWSFKYEAAEAKGLDVVVGIHWIWVG